MHNKKIFFLSQNKSIDFQFKKLSENCVMKKVEREQIQRRHSNLPKESWKLHKESRRGDLPQFQFRSPQKCNSISTHLFTKRECLRKKMGTKTEALKRNDKYVNLKKEKKQLKVEGGIRTINNHYRKSSEWEISISKPTQRLRRDVLSSQY